MATKPFPDIDATRIDGESPTTEGLLGDYHDRDESLISQPVDCRFDEGSTTQSVYQAISQTPVFVPPACSTSDGNVTLEVVFEAYVTGGGTSDVRMRLGSTGTWVELTGITDAAYARKQISLPAADVQAAAGTEQTVYVEAKTTAGTAFARNVWGGASRFERAA